jgi:hypothetical protein
LTLLLRRLLLLLLLPRGFAGLLPLLLGLLAVGVALGGLALAVGGTLGLALLLGRITGGSLLLLRRSLRLLLRRLGGPALLPFRGGGLCGLGGALTLLLRSLLTRGGRITLFL